VIPSHELFVGARVTWLHVPRGGYGYALPVDAVVTRLNLQGDRAEIEVTKKSGATVRRRVTCEHLKWKKAAG